MGQRLADKKVLIVGASSGMGEATARYFAAAGAQVAVAARSVDKLEKLAGELGGGAVACGGDVEDAASVEVMVEQAVAVLGRIDIVVYATGTNIPERSLEVLSAETWDMMMRTNLSGAFHCTKAVLPIMRGQGVGLIIYVSSAAVQVADTSGVAYQATKHGMVGLAGGTFKEERDNGIRTSVIFPGLTDTPLVFKRPVPTPPEVMVHALAPNDVADACLFVAGLPPRCYVPELVLMPAGLA
ncbi:MAG: SDR family NAD(P)-dependent oxidoreductase [Candidatus Latescibacteria bacterium]|nr:SDR family NAD(P)-dependent oxidoreductase [Candidatus Latescibacterota bacterium]